MTEIESCSADSMPEDAWEQREYFRKSIFRVLEKLKKEEKYEDILLNALLIVLVGEIYLSTQDDESFMELCNYFSKIIIDTAQRWIKE